jgi:hypothetical protein
MPFASSYLKRFYMSVWASLIIGLFFFSMSDDVEASRERQRNICICQIDTISREVPFYRAGCGLWLNGQRCDEQVTISITENLRDHLRPEHRGQKLSLGYVGHWSSSNQTVDFLRKEITPVMNEFDMDVFYENTACNPMDNPELVQDYINSAELPTARRLEVRGAQSISIGMWDPLDLTLRANVPAIASTELQTPAFADCANYEDYRCSNRYQLYERVRCVDTTQARRFLVDLRCEEVERERLHASSDGLQERSTYTTTRWTRYNDDFDLESSRELIFLNQASRNDELELEREKIERAISRGAIER